VKTTEQISASTRIRDIGLLEAVLRDEQRRGHVERVGEHWRATELAEQKYGAALRSWTWPEGGRQPRLNIFL
jgi:hypothetical protein